MFVSLPHNTIVGPHRKKETLNECRRCPLMFFAPVAPTVKDLRETRLNIHHHPTAPAIWLCKRQQFESTFNIFLCPQCQRRHDQNIRSAQGRLCMFASYACLLPPAAAVLDIYMYIYRADAVPPASAMC